MSKMLFIRKFIVLIIVFVVGLFVFLNSSTPVSANTLVPFCYTFGDLNDDGQITNADVTIANSITAGIRVVDEINAGSSTAWRIMRADVAGPNSGLPDGVVNANDVQWINWWANNTPGVTDFPVCRTPTYDIPHCHPSGDVYSTGRDTAKVSRFDVLRILENEANLAGRSLGQVAGDSPTAREDADVHQHSHSNPQLISSVDASLLYQFATGLINNFRAANGGRNCPILTVQSTPTSGFSISGSQSNLTTGGLTAPPSNNYTVEGFGGLQQIINIVTTLTAQARAGYNFSSWTGNCTAPILGNQCNVTLTSDLLTDSKTVSANYTAVPPPTPDFSISIFPGTRTILPGNSTTYTVTVTSINNFSGSVNLNNNLSGPGISHSFSSNPVSVPAGGSVNSTINVSTTGATPPGSYPFTVTGTSGALSHSANATLIINTPPGVTKPDYVILNPAQTNSPVLWGPTSVCLGDSGLYEGVTKNVGTANASAGSFTRMRATGGTNPNPGDVGVPALAMGAIFYSSFTNTWNNLGTFNVTFTADAAGSPPFNAIDELNEGNNSTVPALSVTVNNCAGPAKPNLRVRSISSNAAGKTLGDPIDFAITIENNGAEWVNLSNTPAGVIQTSVYLDGGWVSGPPEDVPPDIPPGGSYTENWTWGSATCGNHRLNGEADAAFDVDESNESDNYSSNYNFNIACALPDYVIQSPAGVTGVIEVSDTTPCVGDTVTFRARTANVGTADATSASNTRATSNRNGVPASSNYPISSGLRVNEFSSTHVFNVVWSAVGTNPKTVTFSADTGSSVAESNNNNNSASVQVTVNTCPPDLSVIGAGYTGSMIPGNTVTFNGQHQNSQAVIGTNQTETSLRIDQGANGSFETALVVSPSLIVAAPLGPTTYGSFNATWTVGPVGNYAYEMCVDDPNAPAGLTYGGAGGGNQSEIDNSEFGTGGGDGNCVRNNFSVTNPPWIQTQDGDVGSGRSRIDNITSPSASDPTMKNVEYLAIARGTIGSVASPIRSLKGWLINDGAFAGIPGLGSNPYNTLVTEFGQVFSPGTAPTYPSAPGVFRYGSSFTSSSNPSAVSSCSTAQKKSVVMFINGSLTINNPITDLGCPTTIIVRDNVTIGVNVTRINAFIIANGTFTTNTRGVSLDTQLTINGSVVACLTCSGGSKITLRRDLPSTGSPSNLNTPSEKFTFNPAIFWSLTPSLGKSMTHFTEERP